MSHFAKTRREKVIELLEQMVAGKHPDASTELLEFVGQIGTKTYFQILDDIIAHSEGPVRILAITYLVETRNVNKELAPSLTLL